MRSEIVQILDEYAWTNRSIREVLKQLDPTNIKILSTIAEVGPRNLLEVSRFTGIPLTTVYHRVGQIESKSKQVAILIPNVEKLGMVRLVVLVAAKPGLEDIVTKAMRIPNYWRVIERCEGAFTHHSIHIIPLKFLKAFKEYISTMCAMNLIKSYSIIQTGDSYPIFADFSNYNSASGEWTFQWYEWLNELETGKPTKTIQDPQGQPTSFEKVDLEIIACLELNGRMSFTDIAKKIDTSPQIVKYHYDKRLVATRLAERFHLDVVPYPIEMSAYHEFLLEFADTTSMNQFFSLAEKLFFVDQVSKVLHKNALVVRTRMINSRLENMFAFFSEMANAGFLVSYSAVRLNLYSRLQQTISFELFDDVGGWKWDAYQILLELNKL